MFDLGAPEVVLLLIAVAGVVIPLRAAVTNRLSARYAVIAVAAAVLVPVLGPIAAILITARHARRHRIA